MATDMTDTPEDTLEPTADEIERVNAALRAAAPMLACLPWDDLARAAILAMDRRASPPGEPEWWLIEHDNPKMFPPHVAKYRLEPGDVKAGFRESPLYASPPAPAVTVPEVVLSELRQALAQAEYVPGDCPTVPVKIATFMNKVRRLLAASPTPPAADAPGQGPVYRFLKAGEIIRRGDECPSDDTREWVPTSLISIGLPVTPSFKTMRRLVSAPPTYADAEAMGFKRGVEAAAKKVSDLCGVEEVSPGAPVILETRIWAFKRAEAAIRSLAIPATKGET